jgi:hypothetical protein
MVPLCLGGKKWFAHRVFQEPVRESAIAVSAALRFNIVMGGWHSKVLGDGIVAHLLSGQIQEAFRQLFTASGNPADMAVFTRHDSEGHLHCEVTAYFSPAAVEVARIFAAEPCAKPAKDGLGLLAGDQRCWAELFPGDEK